MNLGMQAKVIALAAMAALVSGLEARAQTPSEGGRKMLVAYFSHTGNTRAIARQIQEWPRHSESAPFGTQKVHHLEA